MAEIIDNRKVWSLLEVSRSIQRAISQTYTASYWIKAEMVKLNYYRQSGHCYPELVEKREGEVVAQLKATIWKNDVERINTKFLEIAREPLKDGISILFYASVEFHPVHGLSLHISDIDPAYTLGEMARLKQETIKKLQAEGIFDRNRQLTMALLPQRIAVISVESSKGYSDFIRTIEKNPWGYKFFHMLFPSLLQGDRAVEDMTRQLGYIRKVARHFDVVAIIRGGGGDVGLNCYDHYKLAREVALFPLPVLTGIGHSTNETVVQMVAFKNNITPTALGEFLLQQFHNFSVPLKEYQKQITDISNALLTSENQQLLNLTRLFLASGSGGLLKQSTSLDLLARAINKLSGTLIRDRYKDLDIHLNLTELHVRSNLQRRRQQLESYSRQVQLLDPQHVLKRGYSITRLNGNALRDAQALKKGDMLETNLFKGIIKSIVESKDDE